MGGALESGKHSGRRASTRIPATDNLTALQTNADDGSSELALIAAP